MVSVGKISIGSLVLYFIFYVAIHVGIGMYQKKLEKENKEKPGNPETEKYLKIAKFSFKWFPFAYVFFVILSLYAS